MSFNETKEEKAYFDSKKPSNPKDRTATDRLDLSIVPDSAVAYLALAFTEGDFKYGGYNWRHAGVSANIYVAACRRHLAKWYNGEENDPATGIPHLASAMACIAVIVDSHIYGNLNDNRPPKAPIAELLAGFEKRVGELRKLIPSQAKRYVSKDTVGGGQYVAVDSDNTRSDSVPEKVDNSNSKFGWAVVPVPEEVTKHGPIGHSFDENSEPVETYNTHSPGGSWHYLNETKKGTHAWEWRK